MKTIISQKLINVLKKRIFNVISLNLFNNVELLLNNLLINDSSNHYFNTIFKAQQSARDIVKSIVISTFKELDNEFKESVYRKSRYYINKSNVPRTLITIVGEITFSRTYYISKHSNKKFFYVDKIFDLPKSDHYDPIVKAISKNRRMLVNRNVFSHYGDKPWIAFMDFIAMKYDFDKIKHVCLLGDGASWIKSGTNELRLSQNNSVKFYLCEFHFKQAIHHITSDSDERFYLVHIFKHKPKYYFIEAVNTIIYNNPKRKDTITKKLNYIINNYSNIKSMLELNIGSSMESHISHLIASFFSARPKGFSTKRIRKYLKLNDYKHNNINIFKLYLNTFSKKENITIDENTYNYEIFTTDKIHNIPVLNNGTKTGTYTILNNISHEISTESYILNET